MSGKGVWLAQPASTAVRQTVVRMLVRMVVWKDVRAALRNLVSDVVPMVVQIGAHRARQMAMPAATLNPVPNRMRATVPRIGRPAAFAGASLDEALALLMLLILLEAGGALAALLLIVWWTMFSGRRKGERKPPPAR